MSAMALLWPARVHNAKKKRRKEKEKRKSKAHQTSAHPSLPTIALVASAQVCVAVCVHNPREKRKKEKKKKAIHSTFNISISLTTIAPMIFVCAQSRKKEAKKKKKKRRKKKKEKSNPKYIQHQQISHCSDSHDICVYTLKEKKKEQKKKT